MVGVDDSAIDSHAREPAMNDLANRASNEPRPRADADSGPKRASAVTLADLPPPGTTRWVVSRKAAVVLTAAGNRFFRPLGLVLSPFADPRLAPWAALLRRFAASHESHKRINRRSARLKLRTWFLGLSTRCGG